MLEIIFLPLFEPALARLDWSKPSSISHLLIEVINAVGVCPVWARDFEFWSLDIICNLGFVICFFGFILIGSK